VPGDGCDAGGDAETYCLELTQFLHHGVDLPSASSLWVENRFGIVEDYEHLLGGQEWTQGSQILGIFDARTDDLGKAAEEMSARGRELVATNEPPVLAEPLLDPIVVEDGQGDGCLPDPPCTDQSDGC
jgi:hypothetical protein